MTPGTEQLLMYVGWLATIPLSVVVGYIIGDLGRKRK